MPAGLRTASLGPVPWGAVLQEWTAPAWAALHRAAQEASQTKGASFGVKIRPVLYHLYLLSVRRHRTRGDGLKLKEDRLSMRRKFFTIEVW